jgi:TonB-linked SusC/RagA family outer membrane protein
MKKNRRSVLWYATSPVAKTLLIMKLIVVLTCLFTFQSFAGNLYSQEKISLNLENTSLKKIFKIIESQTSFRFVYKDEVLSQCDKVSIKVQDQPIENVITKVLANTPLVFKVVGNNLVVIADETDKSKLPEADNDIVITGKVTDAGNQPINKVSILEKGTSNGTTTKEDGSFSLSVSSNDAVLLISAVGFKTQELAVKGRNTFVIVMQVNQRDIDEVVVIGYGTKKRSDVTGSVSSVPKERLSQLPVTNVLHAIQGAVAGVNISQNSSVPGSSANVLIRGVNSITAGTGPLVVLDGVPFAGFINDINPNDIASVDVLKDVSAVAIYGVKGANGVILVTTKRGTTGKPAIRFTTYAGGEGFAHTLTPMSAAQYVQKYADWKAQSNVNNTDAVPTIAEKANYASGTITDWVKEVSQSGQIQNYNLSISGGTKDVKYFIAGDYLTQKGVVKGYQYKRASIRSNLDINITDYLTAGTSLFFANNNYDGGRANLALATQMSPYGQLLNPDGTYYIYPMFTELLYNNPLLGLYQDRDDRSSNMNGTVYAELKPGFVKGLKYKINTAYSYVPTRYGFYSGRNANSTLGSANVSNSETKTWIVENILTYDKNWQKHHIDVTALYSAQKTDYYTSSASATGFINDLLSYNNLGAGATQTAGSFVNSSSLLSQMLRVNYSFNGKYLLTATARRDGYSALGASTTKYGMFPSVALAWNITKENFMQNITVINNLKLRASYGLSGNQGVGINQTTTTSTAVRLPYNGISTIGVLASNLGNTNLKWESTYGTNIGIDFSILNNRISGAIETYSTKTKDLLLYRSIPIITGYSRVWDNLGKVSNKGLEVSVKGLVIDKTNFKWETSVNFSTNKNKIIDLYGDKKSDIGNSWFIGQPVNVIYDYQLQGVWQAGEDASQHDPGVKPGDLKFTDANGSKTISADDRVVLGSPIAKWIAGFTNTVHYKNFHLNIFIQTAQGVLKYNPALSNADQSGVINIPAEITYWTAANGSTTRPSIAYKNPRGYGYASDASYTRIKDIVLSYTAPQSLLDKIKLGGLTLYASGRNLYTFTNWIGWDPENNYDRTWVPGNNSYPLTRTIVVGANITLR